MLAAGLLAHYLFINQTGARTKTMLQAPSLTKLARVRHAFFTRAGGVSQGVYASLNGGVGSSDAPDKVAENRARMAKAMGVDADRLLTPYQVHSPDVVVADEPWTNGNRPRADAVVTRVPRLAIGVSTADCGPLLLADDKAGVVGAAHAGWRGALTGVIEATVAAMERLGAKRNRIIAALGPTIRQPNYEVGPEFVERFVAADNRTTPDSSWHRSVPATQCSTLPVTSPSGLSARTLRTLRISVCALIQIPNDFSVTDGQRSAAKLTTGGISTPLRSPIKVGASGCPD